MSGSSISGLAAPLASLPRPLPTSHVASGAGAQGAAGTFGTSATSVHLSQLSEAVAKLAALQGQSPDEVKVQAGRMARSLSELAAQQSGVAAINLRALLDRLNEAALTGTLGGDEGDGGGKPEASTSSGNGHNA